MPFPVRAGAACLTCLLPYDSQPASLLPAALRTPHLSAGLCCGAPYKSEGTAPCCLCSRAACLPSATVLCLPSATVLLVCPVPQCCLSAQCHSAACLPSATAAACLPSATAAEHAWGCLGRGGESESACTQEARGRPRRYACHPLPGRVCA